METLTARQSVCDPVQATKLLPDIYGMRYESYHETSYSKREFR
jgi:hypothetical protein